MDNCIICGKQTDRIIVVDEVTMLCQYCIENLVDDGELGKEDIDFIDDHT